MNTNDFHTDYADELAGSAPNTPASWLAAIVRRHYEPIEDPNEVCRVDSLQLWNGQWWMPLYGCDTLSRMIDDMTCAIKRQQAANHQAQRPDVSKE